MSAEEEASGKPPAKRRRRRGRRRKPALAPTEGSEASEKADRPRSRRGRRRRVRPLPDDVAAADALEDGHERNTDPEEFGAVIYDEPELDRDGLDPDALKVVSRLARHGFQTYLVGGCVRDLLCGLRPKDFDIATSATPREVRNLFNNSRVIGRRFRLVHIHFGSHILEISTFRCGAEQAQEGEDLLIKRDNVFGRAHEDAQRRDFTINALFYDPEKDQVIDFECGMEDLDRGIIEMIGDPETRLREDPVRMLRAAKFAGRLDFELADELFDGIRAVRDDLRRSAAPRLYEEIQRMLGRGGAEGAFEVLFDTRMLEVLLPEIYSLVEYEDEVVPGCSPSPAKAFWSSLRALDDIERGGEEISPASRLGVLFCHLFTRLFQREGPLPTGRISASEDLGLVIEERLRPIALRLQIPRRDLYRLKQMFLATRRMIAYPLSAKGDKARLKGWRRPTPSQFMRKEYFEDAFQLFRIYSRACGRWQSDVKAWDARRRGEED